MPRIPPDLASLARTHTKTATNVVVGILRSPKASDQARLHAAEIIFDRGWGKPKQPIESNERKQLLQEIKLVIVDKPEPKTIEHDSKLVQNEPEKLAHETRFISRSPAIKHDTKQVDIAGDPDQRRGHQKC